MTYLKWDLSDLAVTTEVDAVTLTLRANFVYGTQNADLSLYEAGDVYQGTATPWNESGLTYNNAPTVNWAAPLQTVAAPLSAGEIVSFESESLRDYVVNQADGDDQASLVLRLSGGCATLTAMGFDAREKSSDSPPSLLLSNPNAVRIAEFRGAAPGLTGRTVTILAACVLLAGMTWVLQRLGGER